MPSKRWEPLVEKYLESVLYTEKQMLLNQKHLFPKACILLIHKNILQEPINMLLILWHIDLNPWYTCFWFNSIFFSVYRTSCKQIVIPVSHTSATSTFGIILPPYIGAVLIVITGIIITASQWMCTISEWISLIQIQRVCLIEPKDQITSNRIWLNRICCHKPSKHMIIYIMNW